MPSVSNISTKLIHIQKVQSQLVAKLAVATAIAKEKRKRDMKRDNMKRKKLLGAIFFKIMEDNSYAELKLNRILDSHLIATSDRALFGLPEKRLKAADPEIPNDLGNNDFSSESKPTNSTTGSFPSAKRFAFSRTMKSTNAGNPDAQDTKIKIPDL